MRHFSARILALTLLFLPPAAGAGVFEDDPVPCQSTGAASFDTAFSTSGKVTPFVVQEIAAAKKSVRLIVRKFSSKPVSEALINAMRAGVDVKVIVDKSKNSDGYSAVPFMITMGNVPHVLPTPKDVYLSYIVIDEKDVVLGSVATLSDTDAEKDSAVGALVIHNSPDIAKRYLANWDALWKISAEMKPDAKK